MRAYLAYALVMIFSLVIAVQPAAAFNEIGIPFITSCGFVSMAPFSNTGLTVAEFNSASLICHDFETLDINFPLFADDLVTGPTAGPFAAAGISLGAKSTSNVLPFGPINLAFPSIGQTVNQSMKYQRTYFFTDVLE